MLHDMRLRAEPFAKIAAGKKTIELRLYDKKRKQIQIGDTIRFTNCDNCQQPIFVAVEKLHIYEILQIE